MIDRRRLLAASALLPLAACTRDAATFDGGWVGALAERGHRMRDSKSGDLGTPAVQRRAGVLIVGAGVAGLGCARALVRAGIDDVQLIELEDSAGGNSRGHAMGGMSCPLGAHYLPTPGDEATEVIALLEDFGLRRNELGRAVYDERHLCHSPQERVLIDGHWHDGLLPPVDALPEAERETTLAQYRRFADAVSRLSNEGRSPGRAAFAIPSARAAWGSTQQALDAVTFDAWLDTHAFTAPALRWYLDYCCRDDYGAGSAQVSAWSGLHYFASRHGFHAPDARTNADSERDDRDGVLTWPEGNGWLTRRMAQPLAERVQVACIALQVREGRHEVEVDVWSSRRQQLERWRAPQVVLAAPLFVSARLLETPGDALRSAVAAMRYAPWLVANLQIDRPLVDRPGAVPAWDNVIYGSRQLGYVDAMHQSTLPYEAATVLTAYVALGGDTAADGIVQRKALLAQPWSAWTDRVVADLSSAHPDLRGKLKRVDLMRYGHAMSIPLPGVRGSAALQALAQRPSTSRVHFAHADLSGYSIFEEALFHGQRAADDVRRRLAASTTDGRS